ncbi:MAG: hypothetical protein ACSLFN_14385 [Candidatus Limnocylindrales bacterium]
MSEHPDDLDRRLRDHFAAIDQPLPRAAIEAARAWIAPRPRRGLRGLLVAASITVMGLIVGVVAVGAPSPDLDRPSLPVTTSPSAEASAAASIAPVPIDTAAYAPGQVLRVTRMDLGDPYEAYTGDRLYVIDVSGEGGEVRYRVEAPSGASSEDASYVDLAADLVEAVTEPIDDPCPPGVDTVSELIRFRPFDRARCLASAPLTIRDVWVDGPLVGTAELGLRGAASMTPWPEPERDSLPYSLAPGVETSEPGWYTLTGRFGLDDDTCGSVTGRFRCRERFVVDRVAAGASTQARLEGTWSRMTDAPIEGRSAYLAIPIDRGVFIWGGTPETAARQGAIYDAATDRWTTIAPAPGSGQVRPAAAWTGKEVLIYGGLDGDAGGFRYDPAADHWSTIAPGPISAGPAVGAWTGDRFLVVNHDAQAAAWDPRTGDWERLPDAPISAGHLEAAWTGQELIVLAIGEGTNELVEGAVFAPGTGRWRPIAEIPYDGQSLGDAPIWTGAELLFRFHAYEPARDRWRILEMEGCDLYSGLAGVWTGRLVLSQEIAFDPVAGRCFTLPAAPPRTGYSFPEEIRTHEFHTPAWNDGQLMVWSGFTGMDGPGANPDGVLFRPNEP